MIYHAPLLQKTTAIRFAEDLAEPQKNLMLFVKKWCGVYILFLFTFSFLAAIPVFAVDITNTVPDITSAQGTGGTGNFVGWVQNFYQFALLAGVFLAVGVIAWAGLRYALAAGNPSGQSDARDQILQAFLGLLLLFGAYLVLYTVNPNLVTNLKLPTLSDMVIRAPAGGGTTSGSSGMFQCQVTTGDSTVGVGSLYTTQDLCIPTCVGPSGGTCVRVQ